MCVCRVTVDEQTFVQWVWEMYSVGRLFWMVLEFQNNKYPVIVFLYFYFGGISLVRVFLMKTPMTLWLDTMAWPGSEVKAGWTALLLLLLLLSHANRIDIVLSTFCMKVVRIVYLVFFEEESLVCLKHIRLVLQLCPWIGS